MLKLLISPGPDASADIIPWPDKEDAGHCLRLNMDPSLIVIHVPEGPEAREGMAAFLRSLSQHAGILAAVLDPKGGMGWVGNLPERFEAERG